MPRIAATGIVLALVSAAIGLNMARYPTVWQMAAPPSQSSPPEETARAAESPRTATLAPAGESRRNLAPEPVPAASHRGPMALPISLGKADSPPSNPLRNEQSAGGPVELHGEPLAEYRRQRDANGTPAAVNAPPRDVVAPANTTAPPAPQPPAPQLPATMSTTWPAEAAASPRVIASSAPPKPPELAITPVEKKGVEKQGDSPVSAETKTETAPAQTVERLTPVLRPISVPSARAPDTDDAIRPLPSVDAAAAAPAPLSPDVLQPVYPSTGMR